MRPRFNTRASFFLQNIALKNEPIVRGPTKQAYLTHEAGINASRTIGSFLRTLAVAFLG